MLTMGSDGLKAASTNAVLNANYMKASLKDHYKVAVDETCMHEVVFAGLKKKSETVSTLDVAKRIIDYGYHPPTMYFPLIVEGALMVEPTETESKETLDAYIEVMKQIAKEAEESPELLKDAPHDTPVRRLDEALAARQLVLHWTKE
jgi:glycine dehydrogenase subunit 2